MSWITLKGAAAAILLAAAGIGLTACSPARPSGAVEETTRGTHHRTMEIDGVRVFYREAGPADAPVVLLLHGFPSSSRMFRDLIPALADRYHVIAPDYPGFGHSAAPPREGFEYSFASYARLIERLTEQLGAERYAIYVNDYGAPVGFRLALAHPDRVTAMVIQNGNAYEEGLSPFWAPIQRYWREPTPANRAALRAGLTPEATRTQYVDGVRDPTRIDPDNWLVDQALLDRPGVDEIMLDLFYDYRTNVELYPRFQAFFRERQPPTLIVWGEHDVIFPADGARAYVRDLPDAEVHLLDSGHFALADRRQEISDLMRAFLDREVRPDRAGG